MHSDMQRFFYLLWLLIHFKHDNFLTRIDEDKKNTTEKKTLQWISKFAQLHGLQIFSHSCFFFLAYLDPRWCSSTHQKPLKKMHNILTLLLLIAVSSALPKTCFLSFLKRASSSSTIAAARRRRPPRVTNNTTTIGLWLTKNQNCGAMRDVP